MSYRYPPVIHDSRARTGRKTDQLPKVILRGSLRNPVALLFGFFSSRWPPGTPEWCLGFEWGRDVRRMSENLRVYLGRREWVFFEAESEYSWRRV